MDRVQRNGGTAGMIAGVLLAILFVMLFALGTEVMTPGDPTASLKAATAKWGLFAAASFIGLLAAGTAIPFAVGVATRLRDAAPTRARTLLYVVLLGLLSHALAGLIMWLGGEQAVAMASRDQAVATTAWFTLGAVGAGFSGCGNAFTGAGTLIAGWAILSTRRMSTGVGWIAILAGAVSVLTLFARAQPAVALGGFLLTIIWLIWAGSELRKTPA